ncbi:alpha/beta hydrolase, partial [Francisella philomiragia]|uniref:alpha/beta hydrolase n=6 Tax=Francisella philomiragia TaxID=28110 RepID=UPI0019059728
AINADEYHQEIFAKTSSLTTHVQDNIAIDTTAANIIDKYTNKVTKDIYLNTEETHTTDDEHNLQFNEVERNLTVENDIFEETQAKEINISANEAINTLYHNQKDTNVDGDLTFEEHELEQNITKGLTLAGGAMAITANELVKHAPQGIHITANKVSVNTAEQLVYGMYSVVSDESNVKDPQKPTNEVLRIYIMDKYCTDEEVAEDDKKILKDKDKIVDYIQDSVLTPLLSNSYIEAKSFKNGDDIGTSIAVEFTQDKYYEIKLTDDIEAICLKLNTLNISNNRFQSLIVGVNGEKAEDVIDGFKHHQNTLSLKPKDWQKIEVKQGKTETINDIETTVNHLIINVFEPPMMINLREDYYFAYYKANQNFGEYNNLIQRYAPLAHYYEPVGYKIAYYDHIVDDSDDFWQQYILKLAKSQNKLLKRQKPGSTIDPNITFAIHGYNVAVEDKINNKMRGYPQALEYMDSQYDITENKLMNDTPWYDVTGYFKGNIHKLSDQKASILPFDSDKESLEYNTDNENTAEGACKWNLQLEYSLNKAAGWDEKSLDDYNRIVQIAWQGNPKAPYDYSAAIAMSEFAGQKLAIIIDYLKQNGIKVNIMAHSLGNAVIMNTLKNVSTPVDQALCWEPAIANDSLSNSNRNEAVQTISNTYEKYENGKLELTPTTQDYNVSYNYAAAASKADKFTIAYSNLDEMLGPIPNIPSLFKKGEIQSMTMNEAVNRMITHVLVSVSSYYFSTAKIGTSFADTTYKLIPNILAGNIDYNKYPEAQAIHEKISDKGAGLLFAIIGVASYALDSFVAQSTSTDTNGGFESIYQIANKFIYPASFFVEGNIGQKCQAFYRKWLQVYPNPNDNKPFLATNDKDMLTGESLYQNLNLREKLRHNFIPIYAYHEKDTLYDIASEVIDKLYKLTNTGVADIPQQVWDNLEDSISNIFNQNPISTVWDTSMSFVGPAVNGAGSLTTTVIDFLKGADIQAAIKNIKDNKEELLAVVFTVLMQPNSKVAPAMGYSGITDAQSINRLSGKLFQTPQEVDTMRLPESTRGNYPCYYIDENNEKVTTSYDRLTDAQKQTAKSMLCIDHSAMLYPTDDFMNYIYKGQLFGRKDIGLDFFGDYDMDEARSNNEEYS